MHRRDVRYKLLPYKSVLNIYFNHLRRQLLKLAQARCVISWRVPRLYVYTCDGHWRKRDSRHQSSRLLPRNRLHKDLEGPWVKIDSGEVRMSNSCYLGFDKPVEQNLDMEVLMPRPA